LKAPDGNWNRENNIVIGGEQKRGRPVYREIECLRVAVGLDRVRRHVLGSARYMHNVFQNGASLLRGS
jgi:hypothetical protein